MKDRLKDPDIARLFENTFPSTLDTTVKYYSPEKNLAFIITGVSYSVYLHAIFKGFDHDYFVVRTSRKWLCFNTWLTYDILQIGPSGLEIRQIKYVFHSLHPFNWHWNWLIQFAHYHSLLGADPDLAALVKAVINNEARYVAQFPYCESSGLLIKTIWLTSRYTSTWRWGVPTTAWERTTNFSQRMGWECHRQPVSNLVSFAEVHWVLTFF